jgi:hypothetical protein
MDISALTAIASLVVALIFNGLAVRDSADQERQAKLATELGLMTQLSGVLAQSEAALDPRNPKVVLAEERSAVLPRKVATVWGETLRNLDYLSWLFNSDFIDIPGARQLWGSRMQCLYTTAARIFGPGVIKAHDPNLVRFANRPRGESLTKLQGATCSQS